MKSKHHILLVLLPVAVGLIGYYLGAMQERLYDRWLDVYLDALYRNPTHEMVSALAEDAVVISQAAGREKELTTGLRHVLGVPLDFLAKSRIEQSLVRGCANTQVTGVTYEHQL